MRIFISRDLTDNAPILSLSSNTIEVVGESLIQIRPLPFDPPSADWIFFYSKNGVHHFFNQGPHALVPYRYGCIGPGTAEALKTYIGEEPDFVGNGKPDEVANSFLQKITAQDKVCYIRAKNSKDSIRKKLQRSQDFSLAVYSNDPKTPTVEPPFDVLIFTSPLNARAYFATYNHQNERIIAIGPTTKKALNNLGITPVETPNQSSEESILKLLQTS